ncbi:hypothetical protein [Nocardia brasiliensis]|nr:hypothetical protein [Nocardia brasiliensis]
MSPPPSSTGSPLIVHAPFSGISSTPSCRATNASASITTQLVGVQITASN